MAIIICVLLLAALFIFPHQRLNTMCDAIEELAQDSIEAVISKDFAHALENLEAMKELYYNDKEFLHMLLSHHSIESLEAAILGLIRLAQVEDQPQSLLELEFVITHVRYLKSVEALRLQTLL